MGLIFGTDGARGVANSEITCELAMNIGRAAALVLTDSMHKRPRIVIGKDTRISSDMLESAVKAGICSVGADVLLLGIVPTPAVAFLVKHYNADAGIMISASHNPYKFNGIKLFNGDGFKLPDMLENKIEELILSDMQGVFYPTGKDIGKIRVIESACRDYIDHVKSTVSGDLNGMKVAIDCSNGSASATAERIFTELGAECDMLFDLPDGININEGCGSTNLKYLSEYVVKKGLDLGIAFDGDADRCLAVDELGNEIDGDAIMAICSKDMKERKKLSGNAVVGTIMTNMGFYDFCKENDIKFEAAKVGDRYVLEIMREKGYNFGGEQSGHIIFLDYSATGDGQLTALQLMSILKRNGSKLSEVSKLVQKYPQIVVNVNVTPEGKLGVNEDSEIRASILEAEELLKEDGRIIVRGSGTEPLIRVMVECKDIYKINSAADMVASRISEKYGVVT